jgi:hypothetical protein
MAATTTQRITFKVTLFEGAGKAGAIHRFAMPPIWARLSRELQLLASTVKESSTSFRASYVDEDGDNVVLASQADLLEVRGENGTF